jgi:archaellum component FlaC
MQNAAKAIVETNDARSEAARMVSTADAIEDLLTKVSNEMARLNEKGEGVYYGAEGSKAALLRDEVDKIRNEFHRIHEQVRKSAEDINEIAKSMETTQS